MWTDSQHHDLDELEAASLRMVEGLLAARDDLAEAVSPIATSASISDELMRSIRTLAGAPYEVLREDPPLLSGLNIFYPSNNLIYSYVLYVLIPSLYTDTIKIRPSSRVREQTETVHRILAPLTTKDVELQPCSQREFLQDSQHVDMVVFTGTSANAREVREKLAGGPSVLSFASSPTPFVIGPQADPMQAARTLVAARLFNGGQDCLCPDAVFVHASIRESLLSAVRKLLEHRLEQDASSARPVVTKMVYQDALDDAQDYLSQHHASIVHGGDFDAQTGKLDPAVILTEWDDTFSPAELFAPIFHLVTYEDPARLTTWLLEPAQQASSSYVSVFGEPALATPRLGNLVTIADAAPLDVENGNWPFGGYGPEAGNVQHDDVVTARPLLISAEAARMRRAR